MISGFFSGYMTASAGHGLVLFVIRNGVIVGVDQGGVKFDGQFSLNEAGDTYVGAVTVTVPPNAVVIQGASSGPSGMSYPVGLRLPVDFAEMPFVTLNTPLGDVNLKLEKLRDLDVVG